MSSPLVVILTCTRNQKSVDYTDTQAYTRTHAYKHTAKYTHTRARNKINTNARKNKIPKRDIASVVGSGYVRGGQGGRFRTRSSPLVENSRVDGASNMKAFYVFKLEKGSQVRRILTCSDVSRMDGTSNMKADCVFRLEMGEQVRGTLTPTC